MGQGYSTTALPTGGPGIDVAELSDLTPEKILGNGRFMKSIRARHQDGIVFVKYVAKPYANMKLDKYVKAILNERKLLSNIPNALGYKRVLETPTSGYLVRQYHYSSLYDRMSTRPFLEDVEKKWLSFQLLCAVRDCHALDVYHGDIKTENTLVTSWNWLYLSDFSSSFKPTYLPEDNPADFSYFFDTSGRRTCYLAPERFLGPGERAEGDAKLTWAMDIFSVGCVIAELFTESSIFSLSQLFKYRKREYDPAHSHLSRIEDPEIRAMVSHMIQVQPDSRYSADEYLKFWRRKAFPDYFYSFLHDYLGLITDPSSGRAPVTAGTTNYGEADDRIDRVFFDFDKISYFLGYENEPPSEGGKLPQSTYTMESLPVCLDIPNNRHQASLVGRKPADDGTLIFLTLVVSSLRHTARATARVRGCDLLLAFSERLNDEAKLDRVLPYVLSLLNDRSDVVKMAAIRTLTQLMSLVTVVSPINAYIFPEYILRRLEPLIPSKDNNPSPTVRATYASCIATLAETAARFLDMVQSLKTDGSLPTTDPDMDDGITSEGAYQALYDSAYNALMDHFETHTKALLTDSDSSVRRAFLGSVSRLCVFFGTNRANDVILTHLNTYLNDKDWMLKCAFFETIVGVATFVGGTSLEEFILPLMVQALTDPEEFVVEKVIRSFASMAELGLFQRSKTWELFDVVGRFTMHPNIWIREASACFLSSSTIYLSKADIHCIISPLMRPYLKTPSSTYTSLALLSTLKPPLPRIVFDMAASWANKVDRGIFWKLAKQQRTFSFGSSNDSIPTILATELGDKVLHKVPRNDEDEQWLSRLRNMGMTPDDEWKLLALREYIWRMAKSRPKDGPGNSTTHLNAVITLKQLDITPQTIFFEDKKAFDDELPLGAEEPPHTIADALLDASTSIDDPIARRKRSIANRKKARDGARSSSVPLRPDLAGIHRNTSQSPSPLASTPEGFPGSPDVSALQSDIDGTDTGIDIQAPSLALGERPTVGDGSSGTTSKQPIRHKPSAINLLNRTDTSKAVAATSTTSTNAVGKVDGSFGRNGTQAHVYHEPNMNGKHEESTRIRATHSYEGNDPNILKLLESLYLEHYPSDVADFGPIVTPVGRGQSIKAGPGQATDRPWRPEGSLVAMLGEHTGPINRVVVAPDHAFFITASDDGTVKVWETGKLESNGLQRPRYIHRHDSGTKVKSICFIENTYCFVSTATDGSVHIMKVERHRGTAAKRYSKLRLMRQYQLPPGEHAVWCEHFRHENASTLILATDKARVMAIDLRSMKILYTLSNPVHHGNLTTFCVDKRHTWLLLGTSHGILDLWDLRFGFRLKAWGLPGATPIHRIDLHPLKGRGRWVCIAGGCANGEITVWDLDKVQCREVYRNANGTHPSFRTYEPWKVDDEKPEGMLDRFAEALETNSSLGGGERGIRAMAVGMDVFEDGRESRSGFILSAGGDRKIRFWDLGRIESSMVVSGLDAEETRPTFTTSHATPGLTVNTERAPVPGPTAPNAGTGGKTSSKKSRQPRSTVISMQQQQLLRSHLDSINDIAVLENPYGMTVSVDRSGIIYVFQ